MNLTIDSRLFEKSLVLGKHGEYLESSDNNLQLTNHKPKSGIVDRIENVIDNHKNELVIELSRHTKKEINNFIKNISYLTEKLNIDGTSNSPEVEQTFMISTFLTTLIKLSFESEIQKKEQDVHYFQIFQNFVIVSSATVFIHYLFQKIKKTAQVKFNANIDQMKGEKLFQKLISLIDRAIKLKDTNNSIDSESLIAKRDQGILLGIVDKTLADKSVRKFSTHELDATRETYRKTLKFIRKKKSEGYYVFLHGQNLLGGMLAKLFTKIIKKLEPERKVDNFQFFRLITSKSIDQNTTKNVSSFLRKHCFAIYDDIPYYRDRLLAVSVNPLDHSLGESAVAYWLANTSVNLTFNEFAINELTKISPLKEKTKMAIKEAFCHLDEIFKNSPRSGNLVAICIPKEKLENSETCIGYRSYAFGIPGNIFNPEEIAQHASKDWKTSISCQARLLSSQIVPENQIEVFHFNTLSELENNKCESILNALTDTFIEQTQTT